MSIGDNIRKKRILKELSQRELAAKVGVSRCQISNIERGANVPRKALIQKIANALCTTVSELKDEETQRNTYLLFVGDKSFVINADYAISGSNNSVSLFTVDEEEIAHFDGVTGWYRSDMGVNS